MYGYNLDKFPDNRSAEVIEKEKAAERELVKANLEFRKYLVR